MNLDRYLASSTILDCTGRVTHTLILRPDGRVTVRFSSGVEGIVCLHERRCITRGVIVDETVLHAALALARG